MTNPIGTSDKTYLPTLETVAQDKQTRWKRLTVQEWNGEKKRRIQITANRGLVPHVPTTFLRIIPALLGLFSIITLLANLHARKQRLPVQQTAWYLKKLPTFSDALVLVKETLFMQYCFATSLFHTDIRKPHPTRSAYQVPRSIQAISPISFG